MMAYLTRPGFNGGGAVSNRTVLPKRKPAAEVKKRKKINYEKIKQYLGKESQELIERELGFAEGGAINPRLLKQRFMQLVSSIPDADDAEIPGIVAQAKQIRDQIEEINLTLAPERQIKITAQGLDFDNPLLDAAKIEEAVMPTPEVTGGLTQDIVPESLTTENPVLKAVPKFKRGDEGTLADPREKDDLKPGLQVGIDPTGKFRQASMKGRRTEKNIMDYFRRVLSPKKFDPSNPTATEGSFADGGMLVKPSDDGSRPGYAMPKGTVLPKNQVKLDNLKQLVLAYNNDPKALYDTTGKMRSPNAFSKNKILIEAGFEKGMLSLDARETLGKLVNEEIDKLLKPAQKFENYISNIMLAEDALAKDFINPREHVAKKFGISYDSEQIKNFFAGKNPNKVVTENKKLFTEVLESGSYKYLSEKRTYKPNDIVETLEELITNDITTGEGDRANLKEATSDNPSLEHFTHGHKLIRKANENRAVSKNKLDEQFKDIVENNENN